MSEHLPGLGGVPPMSSLRKVADNSDDMVAITNMLKAMEGMQEQLAALTDLVVAQDARIEALEKKAKPKLISVRS